MHVYGMTKAEAGAVLSMIAWGMILGSPPLGLLSDKIMKSRKQPFMLCASMLVVVLTCLYLFPGGLSRSVLYLVFFVFSVCASAVVIF